MAMTRILSRSDLEVIMASAVRESGNKPIAVGTAKWLEAIRRLFSFGRIISYDPRLRWGVDYETSTGEVRHFKIFIFTDNESTPEISERGCQEGHFRRGGK